MFHNSAYLCPKVQFDVFPTYSSFAFCTFSFFWVWNWMVLDMFCVLLKRVLFSQEFGHGYLLLFLTLFCILWLNWDHQWECLHSRPVRNEKRLLSNTTGYKKNGPPPYEIYPLFAVFPGNFEIFDIKCEKKVGFCDVGVLSDYNNFQNCWGNRLEEGKFFR